MRAKLRTIQENYNVMQKINIKVWAKRSEHKTVQKTTSPRITSVQYCGGCSVLRGIASVHVGDSISTCGDSISTAEAVQYCGGVASVLQGDSISTVEQ